MLKKTITYKDFTGKTETREFYFNLTEADMVELELEFEGGLQKYIEEIIACKDNKRLLVIFKDIILRSYGERTPDGKYHIKTDDNRNKFAGSGAFVELYMEFFRNPKAAADFINGIIPQVDNVNAFDKVAQ